MSLSINRNGTVSSTETNSASSGDNDIQYINCFLESDNLSCVSITEDYIMAENIYEI